MNAVSRDIPQLSKQEEEERREALEEVGGSSRSCPSGLIPN